MRTASFATSVALAALMSAPALAQTAEPEPQTVTTAAEQPPPEADQQGLEDIVITAQRRAESLQNAAVAVDVVSASDLAAAGVVTAATLNAAVPSLTVQQGGGANTTYFVRGVGNFTNNAYSDPAIAFNLDGVYLGRPTSTTGTFFDLDRIEVLKGPQGTLYGRNATGGAINVIPAKPRLGVTSTAISAGYGNYQAADVEVATNFALGDVAALRIAGKIVDREGYLDDGTSDEVGQALRVQLLVQPSDAVSIRLAADYSHQGGFGAGASYLGIERFTPGAAATDTSPANYTFVPSGLDARSGLLSPEARTYWSRQVIGGAFVNPAPAATPFVDNHYWGVLAEVTVDTGIGTLTVLPAYRRSVLDLLFNGPSFRASITQETDDQFSVEARFDGKRVGIFDWLAGVYFYQERVDANYAINQYQTISFQDFVTDTQSYAAFGRVTANLSDRLRLVAGGRYTQDDKTLDAVVQTTIYTCTRPAPPAGPGCFGGPSLPVVLRLSDIPGAPTLPGPGNGRPFGDFGNRFFFSPNIIDVEQSQGRFTYRLAAEFDIAERSLLYASFETGYRSGGFSTAIGRELFRPEYVDAFTLGSKNRFLDNRLQLNVEAFYWKYRDQQVSHFGVDLANSPNFFTENIGRTDIKGVDVEAQWLVTPTTLISGTVQYLDSEVKAFVYNTPRLATSLPPAVGCAVSNAVEGTTPVYAVDCAGKRGFNSPEWSVNGGVDQTIPLGDYKLVLSGEGRYRSNAVIGFDYLPQQNSGDYWIFDASVSFGDVDDRWQLTGYVRNIADETVATLVQYVPPTAGSVTATFNAPRTYGARLGYKF